MGILCPIVEAAIGTDCSCAEANTDGALTPPSLKPPNGAATVETASGQPVGLPDAMDRSLWGASPRSAIGGELASSHPPVVASNVMPPKQQGHAENGGADGYGQPEEGAVAHPVMVPLVQETGLPVTTTVGLTAPA
jgi:hypothetical protein